MKALRRYLFGVVVPLLMLYAAIPAAEARPAAFHTYYVDCAHGDDSAPGTDAAHPWRTLKRASAMTYKARDRILFRRGTSCSGTFAPKGSGSAAAPISVDAYGSGPAPKIVAGGALTAVYLYNVEGWEVRNLDVSNLGPAPGPTDVRYGIFVKLKDYGVGHHFVIENVSVHDVNGCDCQERHTPDSSAGIGVKAAGSTTPTSLDDVLIQGNTISRVGPEGIATQSDWQHRPEFPSGKGTQFVPLTRVQILRNSLDTIAGDGILTFNTTRAHVAHNALRNYGADTNLHRSGIATGNADDTVVEHNTVTDAHGRLPSVAYDIDHASNNTVFQYNFSRDNNGGALFECNSLGETADHNVYRFNISQDDGDSNSNGFAVVFAPCSPAKDVSVYGNTFFTRKADRMIAASGTMSVEFFDNIFVGKPGGSAINDSHGVYHDNLYSSITTVPAGDPHAVTGDPLLAAPGTATGPDDAQGYQLRAGSPALGVGALIPNAGGRDFFGNPVPPVSPNLGAYQGGGVPDS